MTPTHDTVAKSGEPAAHPGFADSFIGVVEEIDGQQVGITTEQFAEAIAVWHACQQTDQVTVGMAAAAFNASPEFVADTIDRYDSMWFFAAEGDDCEARLLQSDGL